MEDTIEKNRQYCLNCHHPLPGFAEYCPQCGQKDTDGKVSFWKMVNDFAVALVDIDGRIYKTLGHLFIPGKLTGEYFKGRHRRYLHPLRIFLVMTVIHFAVISWLGGESIRKALSRFNENQVRYAYQEYFVGRMEEVKDDVAKGFPQKESAAEVVDSLKVRFETNRGDSITFPYLVVRNFSLDSIESKNLDIRLADLMILSPDSLVAKYEVEGFVGRTIVTQLKKLLTEGTSFTEFLIGKFIWMVVLMMPALALILKLMYIRRRRYYVEHLVFAFHYHAFAFLAVSIGLLLDFYVKKLGFTGLALGATLIYLFLAMRKFYRQGYIKTFFKYSFFNFSYLFIFIVFWTLTLIISALTYG